MTTERDRTIEQAAREVLLEHGIIGHAATRLIADLVLPVAEPAKPDASRAFVLAAMDEAAHEGAQAVERVVRENGFEWPTTSCAACDGDGSIDDYGIESACDDCDGDGYTYDSASQMADALDLPTILARVGPPPSPESRADVEQDRRDLLAALDAEREAHAEARAALEAVRMITVRSVAYRELLAERDEAQSALVALREALREYMCLTPACRTYEALEAALVASPAALAGQVRARVLRGAAETIDQPGFEVGAPPAAAVARWLRALADGAERAT